ncbi:toll-interacting protein-like [Harmonia axyridis]|uniref:toll-interacting protein-like n=1 Tax=Harmonia axyridis TaxID=115357 RepID=UPI001E2796F4|nr:toll-interacting protein-like [Harmonia axyridis]
MASAVTDKVKERRNRVLVGQLPDDFLRISVSPQQQQEAADRQTAIALHQAYTAQSLGRLSITVVQAKLAKNYGMTRMDPYCRLRVGHYVYETNTDTNGGKTPKWGKVVQCMLPKGINAISVEIYDECSFTMDELIAWATIVIPQQVLAGETHEDWYPLNGKQGEGVEGMINLVLSYAVSPPFYAPERSIMVVPNVGVGTGMQPTLLGEPTPAPLRVYTAPTPQVPVIPVLSESELKQIEEMFPSIDKEVIKSVFEANRGNKEGTVNSLLQMSVD